MTFLKLFNWIEKKIDTVDYSTKTNIMIHGITGGGKSFIIEFLHTLFKTYQLDFKSKFVDMEAIDCGIIYFKEISKEIMKLD